MSETRSDEIVNGKRRALASTGLGIAAILAGAGRLAAADVQASEWTAAERANAKIVTDFCAAWPSHDINKVMSFFTDTCAYRVTEAQEPNKGRQAVNDRIASFLPRVVKFEVLETMAKGPMVFNERIDTAFVARRRCVLPERWKNCRMVRLHNRRRPGLNLLVVC
jgi:limonene-1,2-epoxide hydrolase